jgi:hypothetical protein
VGRLPSTIVPLLIGALWLSGCKTPPTDDLTTPESALATFFAAINQGRFPAELEAFVANEVEIAEWRMRCEQRGCVRATYKIRSTAQDLQGQATFLVDYEVEGNDGLVVMRGTESPIHLQREGRSWRVERVGRRVGAGDSQPAKIKKK